MVFSCQHSARDKQRNHRLLCCFSTISWKPLSSQVPQKTFSNSLPVSKQPKLLCAVLLSPVYLVGFQWLSMGKGIWGRRNASRSWLALKPSRRWWSHTGRSPTSPPAPAVFTQRDQMGPDYISGIFLDVYGCLSFLDKGERRHCLHKHGIHAFVASYKS